MVMPLLPACAQPDTIPLEIFGAQEREGCFNQNYVDSANGVEDELDVILPASVTVVAGSSRLKVFPRENGTERPENRNVRRMPSCQVTKVFDESSMACRA
jgi:hypothetical protein